MLVTPISRAGLVEEITTTIAARRGRVRAVLDGPAAAGPDALAAAVAAALRERGRATVVVAAADFLRPASVRLEFGRSNPDERLDRWLDDGALAREVLGPAAPNGSGRVLPRLWNSVTDRAYRDDYTMLPDDGVVLLHGAFLLGRGLPADLAVHLRMSKAALARTVPDDDAWTLPAFARYEAEGRAEGADLFVLADHPDRPAVRRR